MTLIWRELNTAEKQIIQRLARHAARGELPPAWDCDHYRAAEIDGTGSLRLRLRDKPDVAAGLPVHPVASGYFDDKDVPDPYGPLVDIILFSADGVLCELQIYRSDGGAILKAIEADAIFLITVHEHHG